MHTRYSACYYEPDLDREQRAMYTRALFSVLDNLYKEEDQTGQAATCCFSSPGVDFLLVRCLSCYVLPLTPTLNRDGSSAGPGFT